MFKMAVRGACFVDSRHVYLSLIILRLLQRQPGTVNAYHGRERAAVWGTSKYFIPMTKVEQALKADHEACSYSGIGLTGSGS